MRGRKRHEGEEKDGEGQGNKSCMSVAFPQQSSQMTNKQRGGKKKVRWVSIIV